ncbi:MAG: hypothetical protein ABIR32_20450, partial [Ilumatobacteraceae bacterium]
VEDLVSSGAVDRHKVGRRNVYTIVADAVISNNDLDITIAELLTLVASHGESIAIVAPAAA